MWCAPALVLQSHAAEQTNEASIQYMKAELTLEQPQLSESLWTRFLQEVVSSDSIVFDRFTGPASQLAWERHLANRGYEGLERMNANGARLFSTIAADSLRTAAIAALPVDFWQEEWEQGLAYFLTGTIGHPEEEHFGIRSIAYSATRSSWERANENARFQVGARPWRTNPYLYFLANAGRMNGRPLFTLEGRAMYTLFGTPLIEGRLAVQLPADFRVAGASAIDPTRIGSGDPDATHISVTLERLLGSPDDVKGVIFVGFRSGANSSFSSPRSENLVIAGLSCPW